MDISLANREDEKTRINPVCAKLVDYIFIRFSLLCRDFDAMYSDPRRESAEKQLWVMAFSKNNIVSKRMIDPALDKIDSHKYPKPPSLGQVLEWCKNPEDALGFLSKEKAYNVAYQILRDETPKELSELQVRLIQKAIEECGSYFLRNKSMSLTQPLFYRNYEIIMRNYINGSEGFIPKGIENHAKTTKEEILKTGIASGFEHCNSYESAKAEMEKILGVKFRKTTN